MARKSWKPVEIDESLKSKWTTAGFLGLEELDPNDFNFDGETAAAANTIVVSDQQQKKKRKKSIKRKKSKQKDQLKKRQKKTHPTNNTEDNESETTDTNFTEDNPMEGNESETNETNFTEDNTMEGNESETNDTNFTEDNNNNTEEGNESEFNETNIDDNTETNIEESETNENNITEEDNESETNETNNNTETDQNEEGDYEDDNDGEYEKQNPMEETKNSHLDMSEWEGLGLHPLLVKGLRDLGFNKPTSIQQMSIPHGLQYKKDIVGAAETGSGKTLAFGIPIVNQIITLKEKEKDLPDEEKYLKALILSPTRELSMQIVDHLRKLSKYTNVRIYPIVGGIAIPKQERFLNKKPDILVATPGRIWEMTHRNPFLSNLSSIRFLVIDEADRMIEKGHFQELENIILDIQKNDPGKETKEVIKDVVEQPAQKIRRQTFLFSATITLSEQGRENLRRKIKQKKLWRLKPEDQKKQGPSTMDRMFEIINFRGKPQIIDMSSQKSKVTAENLTESKILCLDTEKDRYLYYFIVRYPGRTLVFVNSISCIRRLVPIFTLLRIKVWGIHAQLEQKKRLKNLDRFKANNQSVLIATDVLARGLDILAVDHVIHYQIPTNAETYIHRSGRTARASSTGISVMFVSPPEAKAYRTISYVVSKETDSIPEFPVDVSYIPAIDKRIKAAVELNNLTNKSNKSKASTNWYETQAKLLDIELDDNLKLEQKEKKKDIASNKKLKELKQVLDKLLDKSIIPQGVTPAYLTRIQFEPLDKPNVQHDAIVDFNTIPTTKLNLKMKTKKDRRESRKKRRK